MLRGTIPITKAMDEQFLKLRNSGGLGTGDPVVGIDQMWVQREQRIGGVCVGEGVMGRGIPRDTLLCEYVGEVMTSDEWRKGGSKMYSLGLPAPLQGILIDAGTRGQGAATALCTGAKINDTKIIWRRHGPSVSLASNEEGNSQFACADGEAANCAFVYAQCDGCNAMDAAVLAARGPSLLGGGGGSGGGDGGSGGGGGGRSGGVVVGGGGGGGSGGGGGGGGRGGGRDNSGGGGDGSGGGDVKHHMHAVIYTKRDISAAGEPLTLDYGPNYWTDQINRMKDADWARDKQELEVKLATVEAENRYLSRQLGAQSKRPELQCQFETTSFC
jgi:hypothetical protein